MFGKILFVMMLFYSFFGLAFASQNYGSESLGWEETNTRRQKTLDILSSVINSGSVSRDYTFIT